MTRDLPESARAVIIGGGIVGASTAYHLAQLGWQDVILLERAKLTSGSTFHAAGMVGQLRSDANVTKLIQYSVALYDRLEDELGMSTGWRMTGGLRVARTQARMEELRRQLARAKNFGLEMHLISPNEARDLWPLMAVDDLVGAAYLPGDGRANPTDITMALAQGARRAGVRVFEDTSVTKIHSEGGRVTGVSTPAGKIACDTVINCGGQWAREIGLMAGVCVPVTAIQHQYMITEQIDGVSSDLPSLRDPDQRIYFKDETGGLVMGGYEPNPQPWMQDPIPSDFSFSLLTPDWDHFGQFTEPAVARVPALAETGIKDLIHGPEAFTPDGEFILGEAPTLAGFFVGAGFNAFGIASAGGAGWALAEWVASGKPPLDLSIVDIKRFDDRYRNGEWVRGLCLQNYASHYAISDE